MATTKKTTTGGGGDAAPAPAAGAADVYEAKESFHGGLDDGSSVFVQKGERVRSGHPIYKKWPDLFQPLKVHYDIEDASAEPGVKRGQKSEEKTS